MKMKLSKMLEVISSYEVIQGDINTEVNDIAFDSRKVTDHALFFCIQGRKLDGHQFIQDAIDRGASALVVEREITGIPKHITVIKVKDSRIALTFMSHLFFGEPSKSVNLIGITGTNGKTSVSFLVSKISESSNRKVGVIGTIHVQIGDEILQLEKTTPTTPESSDLHRLLKMMVDRKADDVIVEVSSMALELGRVNACKFDMGVFTNLTPDHLDDHGTIDQYKNAKLKLFSICDFGIVNLDDPVSEEILTLNPNSLTYGIDRQDADIVGKNITIKPNKVEFTLSYKGQEQKAQLKIPGKFSVYNALAATGICLKLGLDLQEISRGLGLINGVRGRFESIEGDGYTVIIDYAHSADALENILLTVKEFAKGKIITVFGCGGDRDPLKRPEMGKVAGTHSDQCIITSDNPRSEDPLKIISDIEKGVQFTNCNYIKIVDRKKAIHSALDQASNEDVVIIAGKGHEDYQEINGKKFYFDDREVVLSYLNDTSTK